MGNYKILSHNGTGLPLNVYGSGTITGRRNVCLWTATGGVDQQWSIDSLGSNQLVRSMNNTNYALNANRTEWNCDVFTVNSDSYVNFVFIASGVYRIQLKSDTSKYLTATGTSSQANVNWQALNSTSAAQKWKLVAVTPPTPGGSKILPMPSGPRCNWNQKHSGVTNLFGGSACTLVAGLNAANFYATNGSGYTPASMNNSAYWIPNVGFTWVVPGPCKIGAQVTKASTAESLAFIRSEIDANRPVIVNIGPSGGQNHTVFAYGYKNGASAFADIYVYDPANMTTSDVAGRVVDLYNAMDYNHDYFNIRSMRPTSRG